MIKQCVLYDRVCIGCGECDRCANYAQEGHHARRNKATVTEK